MTIKDFENVLHSDCINAWFNSNIDALIGGNIVNPAYDREDQITQAIINCFKNPNIVYHSTHFGQQWEFDIFDKSNEDIAEAAHNGTYDPALWSINHIVRNYFERKLTGSKGDFYALMYLLDIENLDASSIFSYSVPKKHETALQKKYAVENYLNKFPGKIQVHEPFHNLKSLTETTIVNYDIYVLKMKFDNKTAKDIYNAFKDDLDFFKKGECDKLYPGLYK